jgi:hypothetical protein
VSRFPRGVERAGLALALAAAVLVWAVTRTYPNYDSYYHLVWGREVLDGLKPSFEAYAAPTQHPLYVALGGVLGALFGEDADRALVLVCLLSHALLVFGAYRLGAAVFGRWSGLLAALFVAASASFLLYAARGYVDAPFLALVVWAGVFEAQSRALARAGRAAAPVSGPAQSRAAAATSRPAGWRGPAAAPDSQGRAAAPAAPSRRAVWRRHAAAPDSEGAAAGATSRWARWRRHAAAPPASREAQGLAAAPDARSRWPRWRRLAAATASREAQSAPASRGPVAAPDAEGRAAAPAAASRWGAWRGLAAAPVSGPALGLLVAAGLLRPEAWVLAGLWWLAHPRVRLAFVVAAAPVLWCLTDFIVTGDPLHSLHATSELADDLGRVRGVQHVPGSFVSFVGATVRPPVAALAPVGALLAWRFLGWRALLVPLALFAAGVITFVGTGLLGLSILPRYLTVPAVALCLFAGYALLGFTETGNRTWAKASAAATVLGVIGLIILAPSLTNVREELRFIRQTHDSLIATLDDPAVEQGIACGTLTFPTYRLVPDARWHAPGAWIGARSAKRRPTGIEVFALGQKAVRRYGFAAGTSPRVNLPSPGFAPVARHGVLAAYRRC